MPETQVKLSYELPWKPLKEHVRLFHREILESSEANELGVHVSSILWEKIEIGGQVLPHYHDVAEVIHITVGQVQLLCNGEWKVHKAGDTFLVPAGVVHSVKNDDNIPTEQISIFLPVTKESLDNEFFKTYLVQI